MKKSLITSISSLFLAVLFFFSCQREVKESPDNYSAVNSANQGKENACKLAYIDWPTVGTWEFQYNDKGLADQWIIDYGYGYPLHTNEMIYDDNNRLIQSNEVYFDLHYVYHFYYTGKKLTRATRASIEYPDEVADWTYTYNSKGQNIRQDDIGYDSHVFMTYDDMGNCTRTDLYFGNELYFSDIYTYNAPARNPKSAVPGVDIGFLFYGTGGMSDKRWFTSNRTEIYDNGNLFLFNDYDPAQTTMITGNHNYPSSATYYDRVTEVPITITFNFENCNGNSGITKSGNSQDSKNKVVTNSTRYSRPLLMRGSAKSMKEQIKKLKQQPRK